VGLLNKSVLFYEFLCGFALIQLGFGLLYSNKEELVNKVLCVLSIKSC